MMEVFKENLKWTFILVPIRKFITSKKWYFYLKNIPFTLKKKRFYSKLNAKRILLNISREGKHF